MKQDNTNHQPLIADLIRNPEVRGRADNKTVPSPCHSEQSEESKISDPHLPTPVILDCTRHSALDPPVHQDENDEERSSSALQAHTLAQRDQRLVNPEEKQLGNTMLNTCWIRPWRKFVPRRRESRKIITANLAG